MFILFMENSPYAIYAAIIASLGVVGLFFLLRKVFKNLIMKLTNFLSKKHPALVEEWHNALSRPAEYLWVATGIYLGLLVTPFVKIQNIVRPALHIGQNWVIALDVLPFEFVTKLYTCSLILVVTWASYNCAVIVEKGLLILSNQIAFIHNDLLIKFSVQIFKFFTIVVGVMGMVSLFFNLTAIITGVGLGGVAFTFVAKDTLTNILSGIILMIDKPFSIGDWVQIDTVEGIVEDISFRSTRIRTFTQGLVVVPNARLSNDNIINWSLMSKRRVNFELGVTYETSTTALTQFIEKIKSYLNQHPAIEPDTSVVSFDNFGDYALNIKIVYYSTEVQLASYTKVKEEVNLMILNLASEAHIEIAFPTQKLFMQKSPQ
jgi:MscS family membrane protein